MAVVVVAAGGALIAYRTFLRGGSGSPEAAVQGLIDAVEKKDPAGIAAAMNPAELGGLESLVTDIVAKQKDVVGGQIEGAELDLSGIELTVDQKSDDVALVKFGRAKVSVKNIDKALPVSVKDRLDDDAVRDLATGYDYSAAELEDDVLGHGLRTFVMAVKQDGGWYISPFMTVAEYFRQKLDLGKADYDAYSEDSSSLFEKGSTRPEAVVDDIEEAINSGDPHDVLALLPSDEFRLANVYERPFADYLEQNLQIADQPGRWSKGEFKVTSVDTKVEDVDDGKRITLSSARGRAASTYFGVDGLCVNTSHNSDNVAGRCRSKLSAIGPKVGIENFSVIVREVDDGWKIDPARSIIDIARRFIDHLDAADIRSALQSPTDGEVTGTVGPGAPASVDFDDSGFAVYAFTADPAKVYSIWTEEKPSSDNEGQRNSPSLTIEGITNGSDTLMMSQLGTVRIGVGDPMQDPEATPTLHVEQLDLKTVNVGETIKATVDGSGVVAVSLNWPGGPLAIDPVGDSSPSVSVYKPVAPDAEHPSVSLRDGYVSWSEGQELAAGTYTLFVNASPSQSIGFSPIVAPQGFEGGALSTDVTLPATVYLDYRAGDVIEISASGSSDLVLTVDGESHDSSGSSSPEYVRFLAPGIAGKVRIDVRSYYSGYSSVPGSERAQVTASFEP